MDQDGKPEPPAWAWWLAGGLLAASQLAPRPPARGAAWLEARVPPGLLREGERDFDALSARELRRLPGIGQARALASVRARWETGLRGGPAAWEAIPGIGPLTVERLVEEEVPP